MKQTYGISGMTCKGCKAQVTQVLSAVSGVENVSVNLEKAEAVITMKSPISNATFQEVLPTKYQFTEKATTTPNAFKATADIAAKSTLSQLRPLFLILGYITVAALLLNRKDGGLSGFMFDFMGLFYIVFSFFKILGLKGFPEAFRMYDPLAKAVPLYGWLYPFIEVGLGLLFLMRIQLDMALVATLLILGITTFGVAKALLNKKSIPCACLGTVLKLPMTKATLIENGIMLIMAFLMLFMKF